MTLNTNKMYHRDNWDTDKLDIHSNKYAGHDTGSSEKDKDYHKNIEYGAKDEDKIKDGYNSHKNEDDDKKKKDDENKKNIVDTVEQDKKYEKKKEEDNEFKSISQNLQQEHHEGKKQTKKKKEHKSIEEAIGKAIKDEKDVVFMD